MAAHYRLSQSRKHSLEIDSSVYEYLYRFYGSTSAFKSAIPNSVKDNGKLLEQSFLGLGGRDLNHPNGTGNVL